MQRPLKILLAEDSAADAELIAQQLRRDGFVPEMHRVETEADYIASLSPDLDVILSDYAMPSFSGLRACELLHERGLDIPFILISGTIGEDLAVEAIQRGAEDYLLKDRLTRLGPAIEHALRQSRLRRERRQAQDELKLFRNLVDQSNDTFEVIDPETGRFLDVNAKGPAELGFTRAEYLSLRVSDIDPTMAGPAWAQFLKQIHAQGFLSGEGFHQRKDGTTFPIEFSARCVQFEREYIVTVVRDITERKLAQKQIHESERRFREMLENLELIAITLDLEGTVTFCNDFLVRLTGWTSQEILGSNWFSKFVPDFPEVHQIFFASIPTGQIPAHFENPILTRDGKTRDIVWNNTVLRDSAGAIIGTASIGEDVTERNRAEERVREQASMLDHAKDAIIVRDISTQKITFWNQGAERLYGWSAEEAKGSDIGSLVWIDPGKVDIVSEELLQSGEFHGEHQHITKAGKKLTVTSHATLLRDSLGNAKSALVIYIDVTEQKALETRFLRAQRMESLGTLAGGMAHDLNNILAPIRMSVSMLRDGLDADRSEEIISIIETSAERGADIVKQVLTFGRGVEGEHRPLQVGALISDLLKFIRETFPKNITLERSVSADLWPIWGDATQIHQVLLNLCVNARDAMPEGGKLQVGADNLDLDPSYASMLPEAVPGSYVVIAVSDTGTGMPPEVLERIFDPFFTTKAAGVGTGLGLSTAMGIVKSHGGFIHVNTEPRAGTTFQVYLSATPDQTAPLPKTSTPKPCKGNGELVLVVDDEANVREAARIVLENAGFQALLACDGTEGLALFAMNSGTIAAVLTDLMMPFMDGAALIRALHTLKPGVPIIASTGLGHQAQVAQLKILGVQSILHKPYGADSLLGALQEAMHPKL